MLLEDCEGALRILAGMIIRSMYQIDESLNSPTSTVNSLSSKVLVALLLNHKLETRREISNTWGSFHLSELLLTLLDKENFMEKIVLKQSM